MLWDTFIVLMLLDHMIALAQFHCRNNIYVYIYIYIHTQGFSFPHDIYFVILFHFLYFHDFFFLFLIYSLDLISRIFTFPCTLFMIHLFIYFFSPQVKKKNNASLAYREHTITCETYGMWFEVLIFVFMIFLLFGTVCTAPLLKHGWCIIGQRKKGFYFP